MGHRGNRLARVVVGACLAWVSTARGAEPPKGLLEEVAPSMRKVLLLSYSKGNLRLVRQGWDETSTDEHGMERTGVEGLFQRLGEESNSTGGGSSGSGDRRSCRFSGGGLSGNLFLAPARKSVRFLFEEEGEPRRSLDLMEDDVGFRVILSEPREAGVLFLSQTADSFCLARFRGKEAFTGRGDSFADFYRSHRDYVERDLFPFLRKIGISTPLLPHSDDVAEAALAEICPAAQEEIGDVLARLDHAQVEQREAASGLLSARLVRYQAHLEAALADPGVSEEARVRLKAILEGRPRVREEANDVATACNLREDREYLMWLMSWAKGAQRAAVARRLQDLTGQKLGEDPAAWEKWLVSQSKGK